MCNPIIGSWLTITISSTAVDERWKADVRTPTRVRHSSALMRALCVTVASTLVVGPPAAAQAPAEVSQRSGSPRLWASLFATAPTLPQTAAGQAPASSFAALGQVLRIGDDVYVVDASNTEIRGRLAALSPTALTLTINAARRVFSASEVKQIDRRRRDSVRDGILIGAGAGVALGVVIGRGADSPSCPSVGSECGQGALIGAVGGAIWGGLVGWLVDTLIRKRGTVYLAPPSGP